MLQQALQKVRDMPTRHISDPKRRGAVALVIRVPGYSRDSLSEYIDDLAGSGPESAQVLFIKRATSERDRWSGHIALPGGRCNPDEADLDAAMRESFEEVGLDLHKYGLYVGCLDQRLVRVKWGTRIAMVLSPFVFVLREPDVQFTLQAAEVAACFWQPLGDLLLAQNWSKLAVPVGDRLNVGPEWVNSVLRTQVGDMLFGAVDLRPTEITGPPFPLPEKLWGITFGIMTDLFVLLEPTTLDRIWLPTLAHWDMRLLVYIQTWYRNRSKKTQALAQVTDGRFDIVNKQRQAQHSYHERGEYRSSKNGEVSFK